MPSAQRGTLFRLADGSWAYRYRDAQGRRPQAGGFETKGEASAALRKALDRSSSGKPPRRRLTLSQLVDDYLEQHVAELNTIATLRFRLRHATKHWGDLPLERLTAQELAAWLKRLPQGSAYEIHKALRQVLNAAVEWSLIDANPARKVRNPEPKRAEKLPFDTWADVEDGGKKRASVTDRLRLHAYRFALTKSIVDFLQPGHRNLAPSWRTGGRHKRLTVRNPDHCVSLTGDRGQWLACPAPRSGVDSLRV